MRTLAGTGAAVTVTALVGGAASTGANDPYYRRLRKPAFQPPPVTFPIVWPALYASIAVASAEVLDEPNTSDRERREFAYALGANLTLNAGWTWLFFKAHRPWLATAESAALALSTADLARRAGVASPRARWLLMPYLAWTTFATVLSGSIARLNRR